MSFNRRELLRAAGAGIAAVPLLDATASGADAAPYPKRLIIMVKGGGTWAEKFWPSGNGTSLRDLTFPTITKALEPFRDDLLFIGGLDLPLGVDPHRNHSALLTGTLPRIDSETHTGSSVSVDWFIGEELAKKRTTPMPFNSLATSVLIRPSVNDMASWRGPGAVNTPEGDPYALFDRVFASRMLGGGPDDSARKAARAEKRSVLDFLAGRLQRIDGRVGAVDREKIDAHLTAVRALEQHMSDEDASGAMACTAPTLDQPKLASAVKPGSQLNAKNHPKLAKMQIDLVAAAMRCDLTRVATINLVGGYGDEQSFDWLDIPLGYHAVKHDRGSGKPIANADKVETYFIGQLAYLLGLLKSTPEGPGSMLDHTAVVWVDGQSDGSQHQMKGLPWIIAGSCGGYFKTGRLVKVGGWTNATGQYWTAGNYVAFVHVLTSLCNAMDVPVASFGDPKLGTGELPGLRA